MSTYNIAFSFNGDTTVAYGASGTLTGFISSEMTPTSAVSSFDIFSIAVSGDTTNFGTVSADSTLPLTVTSGVQVDFQVIYNNDRLHASAETELFVIHVSGGNAFLDALSDDTVTTADPTDFVTSEFTLTATGDAGAPSGVTSFTATPLENAVSLTWTNPADSDLSSVEIWFSTTASPSGPDSYAGTLLSATSAVASASLAYLHESLDDSLTYYYTIFTVDNVGQFYNSGVADATIQTSGDPEGKFGFADEATRRRLYEYGEF